MAADREKARAVGVDQQLSKPVERHDLYQVIASHLAPDPSAEAGAEPSGAVPAESALLPERLPGIDLAAGRRRLDGDDALYARLLGDFARQLDETYAALPERLGSDRSIHASELCHTLKGTAGTLGITAIEDPATTIDEHLKNGLSVPPERIAALERAIRKVRHGLRAVATRWPSTDSSSPEVVNRLQERLQQQEWVPDHILNEAIGYLQAQEIDTRALSDAVTSLDYGRAIAILETIDSSEVKALS
jgi:two-component system sensor histidine kinase/response regulator